jgi:exosortase A-associated hydrolase 1
LLLARRLAAEGYPAMRFDYRGMGDSDGSIRDFEHVSDDISAAISALMRACPTVKRIVLWGLCDAASAALLYMQATGDARIAGLVLLNPWARSEASLAQTHIKHYYGQRLMQKEFWIKLLRGEMHLLRAVRGFVDSAMAARGTQTHGNAVSMSFQDRMAEGLRQFPGKTMLILSGQDYTAKEFLEYVGSSTRWAGLIEPGRIHRVDIPDADHTFSSREQRSRVENETLQWLGRL